MKIAICAEEGHENALASECISRCPFFVLADSITGEITNMPNPAVNAARRRGLIAANALIKSDVHAVIGIHFGDKTHRQLIDHGVTVYPTQPGVVLQLIQQYNAGCMQPSTSGNPCDHNSEGHSCGCGHGHGNGHGQGRGQGCCGRHHDGEHTHT